MWLYFTRRTNLFDHGSKRVLHVAPEACFEKRLKDKLGASYLTADIARPTAMVQMDIRNIQFPDETFDVIYCSHVLEHVREDRRAMAEFARVLRRDGWALIMVPIRSEVTEEDDSVVEPAERLARYGHPDHVRNYGSDFGQRLREAGFSVNEVRPVQFLTERECTLMGISDVNETLFVCTHASEPNAV